MQRSESQIRIYRGHRFTVPVSALVFAASPLPRFFSGGGTEFAFDLRAVHHATGVRIERVASMHGAAIVPKHQVAHAPLVTPGKFLAGSVRPEFVEQRV